MEYISYTYSLIATVCMSSGYATGVQVSEPNIVNHSTKKNISTYVAYMVYGTNDYKEGCFVTNTTYT